MPIETTDQYVRVRVENPDKFQQGSMRTITIDAQGGIKAIVGRLEGSTKTSTQAFLFALEKDWTEAKAKAWVEDHGHTIKSFDTSDRMDQMALDFFSKNLEDGVSDYRLGHKAVELDIKQAGEPEVKVGETINISGYLSTFGNTDRHGDIVRKGAFSRTLKAQAKYPLLLNHMASTDSQMGSFTAIEDEKGLRWNASFLVTPKNIHEAMLIKSGHLNTASMGGLFKYSQKQNGIIEEVMLFEGSIVPVPANPEAVFESMKSLANVGDVKCGTEVRKEPEHKLTKAEKLKAVRKLMVERKKKNGRKN